MPYFHPITSGILASIIGPEMRTPMFMSGLLERTNPFIQSLGQKRKVVRVGILYVFVDDKQPKVPVLFDDPDESDVQGKQEHILSGSDYLFR